VSEGAAHKRYVTDTRQVRALERTCQVALLAGLAIVLGYVETMVRIPLVIPGMKLGLGNAAILAALLVLDMRAAAAVALVKVLSTGLLFGSPTMFLYSLSGTALALASMGCLCSFARAGDKPWRVVVTSQIAACAHVAGQLVVAAIWLRTASLMWLALPLCVPALITGGVVGAIAQGVRRACRQDERRPHIEAEATPRVAPGSYTAFVGKNGAGKTTYALQLAGLLTEGGPSSSHVGMCFQDIDSQFVCERVRDDMGFSPRFATQKEQDRAVAEALDALGIQDLKDRRIRDLSGGEKCLVAAAALMVKAPDVVIFDETMAPLDAGARARVHAAIDRLRAAGVAIIVISHEMEEIFEADQVCVFSDHKLTACVTPHDFIMSDDLIAEAALELPSVLALSRSLVAAGIQPELSMDPKCVGEALCRLL
jgi:energy-coupling factor transporter ATP-binding protein EcfA2/uncharacterized membrane protein